MFDGTDKRHLGITFCTPTGCSLPPYLADIPPSPTGVSPSPHLATHLTLLPPTSREFVHPHHDQPPSSGAASCPSTPLSHRRMMGDWSSSLTSPGLCDNNMTKKVMKMMLSHSEDSCGAMMMRRSSEDSCRARRRRQETNGSALSLASCSFAPHDDDDDHHNDDDLGFAIICRWGVRWDLINLDLSGSGWIEI